MFNIKHLFFFLISFSAIVQASDEIVEAFDALKKNSVDHVYFKGNSKESIQQFFLSLYKHPEDRAMMQQILGMMTTEEIVEFDRDLLLFMHPQIGPRQKRPLLQSYRSVIECFAFSMVDTLFKNNPLTNYDLDNEHQNTQMNNCLYISKLLPILGRIKIEHLKSNLEHNMTLLLPFLLKLEHNYFIKNPSLLAYLRHVYQLKNPGYFPSNIRIFLNRLEYFVGHNKNIDNEIAVSPLLKKEENVPYKKIPYTLIYNNDGYDTHSNYPPVVKKGISIREPLANNPIGYVIILPVNEEMPVKNIVVNVYGGWQKNDLEKVLNRPKPSLSLLEQELVDNGTAIIYLNLPDVLKNELFQRQLDESLLKEIHNSIDYFYLLIRNNPIQISELLIDFYNKPIFLMGSSFGGMMSIYHAINYPDSFDGYISHAGGLYGNEAFDSDTHNAYLKVAEIDKIKKIKRPLFIHHSLDDNRVHVQASLQFFNLAQRANKKLVKLFIDDHGNDVSSLENDPDLHGHFIPEGYDLRVFCEQLIDFINSSGYTIETALNHYRYQKYQRYAQTLAGRGNYLHKDEKRTLEQILVPKALHYYSLIGHDEAKITTLLLFDAYEERLESSYINSPSRGYYAEVGAIKQEIKKIFTDDQGALQYIIDTFLKDSKNEDSTIFVNDLLSWLHEDVDINSDNNLMKYNCSMLHFFLKYCTNIIHQQLLQKNGNNYISTINFYDLIQKNIPQSYIELIDNHNLQGQIRQALKDNRAASMKVIYKKIAPRIPAAQRLLESYRASNS